ncbi:MAG: HlyD family secretion protein [Gammaproteobacteria bacterium]
MRKWGWVALLSLSLSACEGEAPHRFQGYVEGEALQLAPGRSGRLDALSVQRGDEVAAGQALFAVDAALEQAALHEAQARLEDLRKGKRSEEIDVLRAQLIQARAQAALSATQLKRQQALYAREAISGEQLDEARTAARRDEARVRELEASIASAELAGREDAIHAAEAQVRQAQASLAEKSVSAPAAGRIEDIYFRPGEWVPAGSPVLALLPPERRVLRFFVPEPVVGTLRIGQGLQVHCDGCGEPIAARLSFIASSAEFTPPVIFSREQRAQLVYRAEARPAAEDATRLHPGQPVDVELLP